MKFEKLKEGYEMLGFRLRYGIGDYGKSYYLSKGFEVEVPHNSKKILEHNLKNELEVFKNKIDEILKG